MTKRCIGYVVVIATLCLLPLASFAEERTGVTDKEILIGCLGPVTGGASNLGPSIINGATLAVKQVNAKGGIHGRKIRLIPGDTVCGASQGLAIGKKLIYDVGVFGLEGLACSHVGMALRPIVEKENVPFVISMAQGPKVLHPFIKQMFRTLPPTNVTGMLQAIFMHEYFKGKYKRVAILHTQEEYGSSGRDATVKQLAKYGITPVAIETHKIGDSDYSAQLLKIKAAKPEVIIIQSYTRDQAVIAKQAYELGMSDVIKIAYTGAEYPITIGIAGKAALENFYGPTTNVQMWDHPDFKEFYEMTAKEFPEYVKNPNNPASGDVGSYVSMLMMIKAMELCGRDLTRSKFIHTLETMGPFKTKWMPPIQFSPTDHEGLKTEVFITYDNGKPRVVSVMKSDGGMH